MDSSTAGNAAQLSNLVAICDNVESMSMILHLIVSMIIALNVTAAMPVFLPRRFKGKIQNVIAGLMLFIVSLFPIIPDFASLFVLFCIAFTLWVLLFFKGSLLRRIAFSAIFFSIIGAWSYLTVYCVILSARFNTPHWMDITMLLLISVICIAYFSLFRVYVRSADESSLDAFTDRLWGYTAFIALCPPIVILLLVSSPPKNPIHLFLSTFFVVAASSAMLPMIYQIGRSNMLTRENQILKERTGHYREIENEQLQVRKFKHDLMNHFTVIATYLDLGQNDKAIEYFKKLGTDFANISKTYTKNSLINAVLNSKYQKAMLEGIELRIQADADTSGLEESTDLCTLIANSIDNAIEAKPEDGKISLVLTEDGDNFLFICTNRYSGERTKGPDGIPSTTKDDRKSHGFGMKNIKEAVKRMNGTVDFTMDGQVFTVRASIPMGRKA